MKELTRDTSTAITWTCNALSDLEKHLLNSCTPFARQYARLGFFQQDDLEKHFSHFRRSAGCNYFLTAKEVFATHSLDKARQMLAVCESEDVSDISPNHACELCAEKTLCETEMDLIEALPSEFQNASSDDQASLFYMACYIVFKHPEHSGGKRGL